MFGLLLFTLSQSVFELMTTSPLAYSEFKQLLHGGLVKEVTVSDTTLTGTLRDRGLDAVLPKLRADAIKCGADGTCPFTTVRVDDPGLVRELEAARVRYVGKPRSEWLSTLLVWLLPMLLLFWAWGSMFRRGGAAAGPFGIARGGARIHVQGRTGVGFADVAGADEACDALTDVVECLKNPQRCRRLGGRIPAGVLIVGARGTGNLPDLRGRQQILQVLVRKILLATDVDLGRIAARTTGLSGAGLASLVNEAALLALRRGKERADRGDFDEATGRLAAGAGQRARPLDPIEKETLAVHEAGHALVAAFGRHADPVGKVAIIPRGIAVPGMTSRCRRTAAICSGRPSCWTGSTSASAAGWRKRSCSATCPLPPCTTCRWPPATASANSRGRQLRCRAYVGTMASTPRA